jgi:superfamily II DNA or RNA helicase
MRIPYVIDNRHFKLGDILNQLLAENEGRSFDVATAYFNVGGFKLLRDPLSKLGSFRLLLGAQPTAGSDVGLRPFEKEYPRLLGEELAHEEFRPETMEAVEELIRFLHREQVEVRLFRRGFLHAKCYILYGNQRNGRASLFDHPVVGIVGSSNFTLPGLMRNRELNLTHRVIQDVEEAHDLDAARAVGYLVERKPSDSITPQNRQLIKSEVGARAIHDLAAWYNAVWEESDDFKEDLINVLDESKFGTKEYTPYEIYLKAIFELYREELESAEVSATRSVVELAEFQEDAVKKARKILARHDGVMIADSVGLGKTWIGKKLLEDFAYHQRMKALVVCPASLRPMWDRELKDATISAHIISHEELGQQDFPTADHGDADLILVDESHNFRNNTAQRYGNLDAIISRNGGLGRDGVRKKLVLLTATPISNNLFDLYNQINLIAQNDQSYFASAGIGDLRKYFMQARKEANMGHGLVSLYNLLDEVVIRRTRQFIRKVYPEATIGGRKISFPERKLRTVRYDLEKIYEGIYETIVAGIDSLQLAPYNLEAYKKPESIKAARTLEHEFQLGREQALVGIFKTRYLKRFESSIEAFRISVRRALQFQETYESYILDGKVLGSNDFQRALRYLTVEDEEDDATISSLADRFDVHEEIREIIASLPATDPAAYDLRKLHQALKHDIDVLRSIWERIKVITPARDAKLESLKELLRGELRKKKVLIFTYYKDTARYLYHQLGEEPGGEFRKSADNPHIRRMDSGAKANDRARIIREFAPVSNGKPELKGSGHEIDVLISTDVLSEGQNLQDCGHMLNYDLHWNPTRMVQRAGRIDRIGTEFATLWVYNMFPDAGLEKLLRLVESLTGKIEKINSAGFLDASILGEEVQPKTFNTLRRIQEEDDSVIEEEEQFSELVSNEFLIQQLHAMLGAEGREKLENLPDGIHSGLAKPKSSGMFFYFKGVPAGKERDSHFWRYYDAHSDKIIDNRYLIANLIACERDTPRVIGVLDPFAIQEKIIASILTDERDVQALEAVPPSIDPIQGMITAVLQAHLNSPKAERGQLLELIKYLNHPLATVQVRQLKAIHKEFTLMQDIEALIQRIAELNSNYGVQADTERSSTRSHLQREDLRLICFEHVVG